MARHLGQRLICLDPCKGTIILFSQANSQAGLHKRAMDFRNVTNDELRCFWDNMEVGVEWPTASVKHLQSGPSCLVDRLLVLLYNADTPLMKYNGGYIAITICINRIQ